MLETGKPDIVPPPLPAAEEVDLGTLLDACDADPSVPLLFAYDGRVIRPGYHVTEVKAGQFAALDCGGNPEAWSEIFVQLWDIVEGDRTHMLAGKFADIIRKVSRHVGLDMSARLTFEVSDGVAPMQLYAARCPEPRGAALQVELSARPASCKPRDRWLDQERRAACCSSSAAGPCG